jgi:methylated-DNA-[protein]-cysteine S-methyltransferase
MNVVCASLDTDIGPVNVAATERGVVAVEVLTPLALFVSRLEVQVGGAIAPIAPHDGSRAAMRVDEVMAQLERYFAGQPEAFDVDIDLGRSAGWDTTVLGGVRAIPWGEVSSYGRVAARIGRPGAARAVGGAVGRNPIGIVIPCHRVIAGDGTIGGYGGDWWGGRERLLDVKRHLLELEGWTLPVAQFAG